MTTNADIQALMAQLGAMNYTAPSSYTGYKSSYVAPKYRAIKTTPWNFNQDTFTPIGKKGKDKGKVDLKPDLLGILDGTFGNLAGFGTTVVDNIIDAWKNPEKNINTYGVDQPLWMDRMDALSPSNIIGGTAKDFIKEIGKGQMDKWKDGVLTWGDVPLVGGLDSLAKSKTRKEGKEILDRTGMKDGTLKTVLGLGIDIAADPTTYATFGLGAAVKASKLAGLSKLDEIAKAKGIAGKFKNVDDLVDAVSSASKATFQKSADDIVRSTQKQYAKYPNLIAKMTEKRLAEHSASTEKLLKMQADNLKSQVNAAKATAYNANINKMGYSLPLSNKVVGKTDIPKWMPNYRTEATMANHMDVVDNLLSKATLSDAKLKTQIIDAAKARYGIDDIQNITKTQFNDLAQKLEPLVKGSASKLPDSKIAETMVSKSMPNEIFDIASKVGKPVETVSYARTSVDDILKQIDPKVAKTIEPMLRGMGDIEDIRKLAPEATEMFGEFARKITKTIKGKTATQVQQSFANAAKVLKDATHTGTITKEPDLVWKELNRVVEIFAKGTPETNALRSAKLNKNVLDDLAKPFEELNNAKTKLEHAIDRRNPFDARTLKTKDSLVNSMANHIADANTRRLGENAKHTVELERIQKAVKGFSKKDMEKVIYAIEKRAPESMGGGKWVPDAKTAHVASLIKTYLDKLGNEEVANGVLSGLRRAYFPHVINRSDDAMKAIEDFATKHPEAAKLVGTKSTSKFDKTRKSFETLADRDNYIAKLEKAIQNATDDDTINALTAQQNHVADIFEVNVVEALQRRTAEGVRAGAAKAMQGELKKFGMMDSAIGKKNIANYSPKSGLVKLEDDVAKKLGLPTKTASKEPIAHYVQEDVLEGMKRVDEIFTNQKMNSIVRTMGALNDIWRPLVTYYKPSHYVNNAIGNTMVNAAAGVSLGDYTKSATLLKKWKFNRDSMSKAELEIMAKAYRHNVIAGGFLFDSKRTWDFKDTTKLEKFADLVGENKVIKGLRRKGEHMDDVYRMANFVNGMRKYGNTNKAAEQVRTYLFNYNELTSADRGMRTLVPFWNWTKNNIPLQTKLLFDNPKFAQNIGRFYQLFNEDAEVPEGKEYLTEGNNYIKIGDNLHTSIQNPVNDLNYVMQPQDMMGSLNPILKSAIELNTNHQFFGDRPISYGSDTVQEEDVPKYLLDQTGIGKDIYNLGTGERSFLETISQLIKPTTKLEEN